MLKSILGSVLAGALLLGSGTAQVEPLEPLEPVGDDPLLSDVGPLWSPDGELIAFSSNRAGNSEVFTVRPDGSDMTQITDVGATTYVSSWSADGKRMLVESDVSGDREIYLVTLGGSAFERLTRHEGRDSHAAFVPHSDRIVFYSMRDGNGDVYSMTSSGADLRRLTSDPGVDIMPVPSPDGEWIVFGSDRSGDRELFVMPSDGGRAVRLTDAEGFDGWARWSPDGSRIAFTSGRDGDNEVFVMNVDGSDQRRLTDSPGNNYMQDWGPRGERLVMRSDGPAGRPGLEIIHVAGGSRERITNPGASDFARVVAARGVDVALRRLAVSPGGPRYFHEAEVLHLALESQGLRAEARRELLEQGLAAFPDSTRLLVRLGQLYLAAGHKSASVAMLERAVRLSGVGAEDLLRQARAD